MKKLIRSRQIAFILQQAHCFYCLTPIWLQHPREAFGCNNVSPKVARYLQCTAEHLKPVSEGGTGRSDNIVAACYFCNSTRHKAKRILSPERYAQHVRKRITQGRWHVISVKRALLQRYEADGKPFPSKSLKPPSQPETII
jgi:hypothetical protein